MVQILKRPRGAVIILSKVIVSYGTDGTFAIKCHHCQHLFWIIPCKVCKEGMAPMSYTIACCYKHTGFPSLLERVQNYGLSPA